MVWAQSNHHADEPGGDREPVARENPFSQHRHRQQGYYHGRDEGQGIGLGQSHGLEADDEQDHGHDAEHGTQKVQAPAQPGTENQMEFAAPRNVQAHQGHRRPATHGGDLRRGVGAGKHLEHRVHAGKHGHSAQHEDDTSQISGKRHRARITGPALRFSTAS